MLEKISKQTFSPVFSQLQEYGSDDISAMASIDRKNEENRYDQLEENNQFSKKVTRTPQPPYITRHLTRKIHRRT